MGCGKKRRKYNSEIVQLTEHRTYGRGNWCFESTADLFGFGHTESTPDDVQETFRNL
jgi:hypothetical protein